MICNRGVCDVIHEKERKKKRKRARTVHEGKVLPVGGCCNFVSFWRCAVQCGLHERSAALQFLRAVSLSASK